MLTKPNCKNMEMSMNTREMIEEMKEDIANFQWRFKIIEKRMSLDDEINNFKEKQNVENEDNSIHLDYPGYILDCPRSSEWYSKSVCLDNSMSGNVSTVSILTSYL